MEDSKNDPLNSVITETVNLTVSRSLKVQIDVVQGSNSTDKNFKKFIRVNIKCWNFYKANRYNVTNLI